MNAKKIMGAVLVALLAAALFVGAGAAVTDGQTVFVNEKVPGLKGTWTSGSNSITALTAGENGYFTGSIVEGVYVNGTGSSAISIVVKYPTISVSGVANKDKANAEYMFIPGTFYVGSTPVNVTVDTPASAQIEAYYLTIPGVGEVKIGSGEEFETIDAYLTGNPELGEHSIRALFGAEYFVNGTLYSDRISKPVTFTVAEDNAFTISASVAEALPSDAFIVTITGQPGKNYTVEYGVQNGFYVAENQLGLPGVQGGINGNGFTFEMPNTGKVEFTAKLSTGAVGEDSVKMKLINEKNKEKSVTINVLKGTITAKTDAASYFIGDIVTISGTSTAGDLNLTILKLTGTNFIAENLSAALVEEDQDDTAPEWSFKLDTSQITNEKPGFAGKMIDVGTYTLTIETVNGVKATVVIVLKQPFISILEAPEVIVKGEKAEFLIEAEAAKKGIAYYIFGTNYFVSGIVEEPVNKDDAPNQFAIKRNQSQTDEMDAGQYFMVVQHPMYDELLNIMAIDTGIFLIEGGLVVNATSGELEPVGEATLLFDVFGRQTANAAQALCDALDTQNIDDMYVKYSFFVVGKDASFTISDIPATIAQGETLTISGVSTANAGNYVTVEMISTAFAAVPKDTVGSAAFIAVTTQVADDGTWEVTFDTSDLNVDEYSLKVAVTADGKSSTWKNVNINVVEGADEPVTPDTPDTPVTPDTPDEPVAPATPGFGALAALAGLGAVAVLLLRRE